MSDLWQWFHDREIEYEATGDRERLQMARIRSQAFGLGENDPAAMLRMYQKGRDLAHRLGEPWWVFLYDVWITIAYKTYAYDLQNGLKHALHCVHEARKPVLKHHPWSIAAYNNLLGAYVHIDPVGYADAIRQCIRHLEEEIPPGPSEHRYVMMVQKCEFLMHVGRIKQAEKVVLRHLALFDRDPDPDVWYAVAPMENMCWIAFRQRDWQKLESYAKLVEENALTRENMQFACASARIWLAVVARKAGDKVQAARRYRAAVNGIGRSQKEPCREHYDALACFHELGEDLDKALEVRDRQLAKLVGQGRHGCECETYIERCELLARMGRLTRDDLTRAKELTTPLKKPKPYQTRIQQLEKAIAE